MKKTLIFVAACTLALAAETGPELFQKAVTQERAAGNLEEAIKLYQRVAKEFASDRALAAKALVQAARCYEKLGQDKSVKLYEQVTREFADQRESAAAARERLAALAPAPKPKVGGGMVARQIPLDGTSSLRRTDGRHIFYVDAQGLMVRGMNSEDGRLLFEARGPVRSGVIAGYVISRDGKYVAIDATRDREALWVAAVDGTGVREIYPVKQRQGLRILDWSPDGSLILASIYEPDKSWSLLSISVADGSARKLAADARPLSPGKFSPDGRFVAYSTPDTVPPLSPADIYALAVDGGEPVKLVEHTSGDKLLDWSPDGSHLLFLSDRKGTPSVFALPVSRGRAAGEPVLIKQDTGFITYGSMSPEGTLYYTVGSGRHSELHIFSVDPVRKIPTAPPRRLAERRMETQEAAAWSPDGRSLAYITFTPRQSAVQPVDLPFRAGNLIIREAETGHERQFEVQGLGSALCWSPGGDAIFFGSKEGFDVQSLSPKTGEVTRVAHYPANRKLLSISRAVDGKAMLIGILDTSPRSDGRSPGAYVLRHDLATGQETEVISKTGSAGLVISPDGTQVASIDLGQTGRPAISVKPLAEGDWKQIAALDAASFEDLVWLPSGEELSFTASVANGSMLYVVSSKGGPAKPEGFMQEMGRASVAAFHPDGRQFLLKVVVTNQELWALENLTSKLKPVK